ncbi:MAG: hypothetical protein HY426_02355 [Candidatus Levybacteria bacterium]|nr:hypothetical protein [Candidatus Levybacteria bacterium]
MSEQARKTPEEIVARASGFSVYRVHTDEAGGEIRVPMMPTHVPEAIIPDDHRTNMINGAGITVFLIGLSAFANYGVEYAGRILNNEQRDGSFLSLVAAGVVIAVGSIMQTHSDERREATALFNSINQGTAVFESPNPPQP